MNILFIGTTEIIVIVVIVLLLFGGKKIPELMSGVGKGVKSFKDGMNGLDDPKEGKGDGSSKKNEEKRNENNV
ncbi:MAG: twin-arginine translocase TatA/TatE family subunit [Bacteroidales bacterium]|nr:twin-arginine translocase TatA/TatE family subunit [Bacteroidales bacterium]